MQKKNRLVSFHQKDIKLWSRQYDIETRMYLFCKLRNTDIVDLIMQLR